MEDSASVAFASFFEDAEPKLRLALSGAFGIDLGRDAAAEALAWGWQNWERLTTMDNPVGYLYRVGRSRALRVVRRPEVTGTRDRADENASPDIEPRLLEFLADLPERQRVAVWMVHGLGYSHGEVGAVLGCATPTVATHVRRALEKLRARLEVESGV
jgi:RNA polymerase sigma factor (sigma-70 family)